MSKTIVLAFTIFCKIVVIAFTISFLALVAIGLIKN